MRKHLFNNDWLFFRGDGKGAQEVGYEDGNWSRLCLPHDWSVEGPFDQGMEGGWRNGFFPLGVGWYRKRFSLEKMEEHPKIWIDFDGVYRQSDVWINGHFLGRRTNGYVGFSYDLTPYLDREGMNVLAVRCDNSVPLTSRWYTGNGIYRHAWLRVGNELSVPLHGTYVTTPVVELDRAVVQVETRVRNEALKKVASLDTVIVDAEGNPIARARASAPVGRNADYIFTQKFEIAGPLLWSPDRPHLYKMVTRVLEGGVEQDCSETVFGIRRVEFSPEKGFLLNGAKLFLKGVNLHHELGCLGAAAFDAAIERRLRLFKEMGCNAIRLSHNPHAPHLLDQCDRLGLLVYGEAFDKWTGQFNGYQFPFEETWRQDLRAFLDRDKNHPCIFIWSVGNEPIDSQLKLPDYGAALLQDMVAFTKACEPSRAVTCALFPARAGGVRYNEENFANTEPPEMAFQMDVVSSNYLQDFFQRDHDTYPQMTFLLSEATVSSQLGGWFDYKKEYVAGHFFWGGTDYFGESFGWPCKGWFKGLVDICGYRKPISYYAESVFSDVPMVRIAVYDPSPESSIYWNDVKLSWQAMESHWNWGSFAKVKVATFTNCDAVELLLNGISLGRQWLADCAQRLMEWEVPFESGVLEAVAFKEGRVAASHEVKTAGDAYKLAISPDKMILTADAQDLCHVTVSVVDRDGILVPEGDNQIHFEVEGEGTSAGVGNGDLLSEQSYRGDFRTAHKGVAQIVLRSSQIAGWIRLKVSAESLASATLKVRTVRP